MDIQTMLVKEKVESADIYGNKFVLPKNSSVGVSIGKIFKYVSVGNKNYILFPDVYDEFKDCLQKG